MGNVFFPTSKGTQKGTRDTYAKDRLVEIDMDHKLITQ